VNVLIVSDLHFGEELLPGATIERRRAVELGAKAFHEFVRYHGSRRLDGKPWRLVIAGDLFDFMSVHLGVAGARTSDERLFGHPRTIETGIERLAMICGAHQPLLKELVRFAAGGHQIDIIVGNHDVELLAPEVVAELERQLVAAGADPRVLARIRVVPWFIYLPGVAWIEHGHVYDEGCSFEFNLAPCDPEDGRLVFNADYAAVRYLGTAVPEIDPHGVEEWGLWGFMRYAWGSGLGSIGRMWLAYARFVRALFAARGLHRSSKRRARRREEHKARIAAVAAAGGVTLAQAQAIDRLARAPMTYGFRRLTRMLMFDRFGLVLGVLVLAIVLFALAPVLSALVGTAILATIAALIARWLGKHMVTSQLPMRHIPPRIREIVDAPFVVFGHTHDPRWQALRGGGAYVNTGTWLPATRPGLRRSFTHVLIQPREGGAPRVELRQWREGASHPFDAKATDYLPLMQLK